MNLCRDKEKQENCMRKMAPKFPDIKKRENIRQNEVLYASRDNQDNVPNEFGDRFIPRRYAFNKVSRTRNLAICKNQSKTVDVVETRLKNGYWRNFNYKMHLSNVFDVKPERLFQFNDENINPKIDSKFRVNPPKEIVTQVHNNTEELDWQCKPRSKPCAFIDSTHDLPGFRIHSSKQIIDWSYKGQIGASFGSDLVIWTCNTDKTVVYNTKPVTSLRFSPDGEYLALGSRKFDKPFIQIWSMKKNNKSYKRNVLCLFDSFLVSQQKQEVVCIEWHPKGTHILCGMNTGKIYIVDSVTSETTVLRNHTSPINTIKFNMDLRYLATSDNDGMVVIIKWPTCEIQGKLRNDKLRSGRAIIDWHPWNPIDIAIAMPTSISIVNIQTKQVVAQYCRKDKRCIINAIAFNKISAEMVVSYSIKNPDGCVSFEILIMASFDRIVDVLKCHEDRVQFLLFSPDGKQLATAGDDDMLSIFNFFTQTNSTIKKYQRNSSQSNSTEQSDLFKAFQIR